MSEHDPYRPAQPYGQRPDPAYGQSSGQSSGPPYAQPGYGQPAYGQPYGQPGYGAPPLPYAHWIKRVAATLVDSALQLVAGLPLVIGYVWLFASAETTTNPDGTSTIEEFEPLSLVLILVGALTMLAFIVWNYAFRQGRTGRTLGKSALGITLVREIDGRAPGVGMCIARYFVHIVDGFCYLGYLWPLWDAKRQTFTDKILSTVVLDRPNG